MDVLANRPQFKDVYVDAVLGDAAREYRNQIEASFERNMGDYKVFSIYPYLAKTLIEISYWKLGSMVNDNFEPLFKHEQSKSVFRAVYVLVNCQGLYEYQYAETNKITKRRDVIDMLEGLMCQCQIPVGLEDTERHVQNLINAIHLMRASYDKRG